MSAIPPSVQSDEQEEPEHIPFLAVGNSEPIPEGLPEQIKDILRKHRRAMGWNDDGSKMED
jgi:hypothetical protein